MDTFIPKSSSPPAVAYRTVDLMLHENKRESSAKGKRKILGLFLAEIQSGLLEELRSHRVHPSRTQAQF
ncbi:conserved hypothetical protein [Ricinus communis]|uniref:Uncharacterized protein n=1 Tax=Ricinus communis TaxID=3988 RepID=B9SSC1_RICCO|nr:conserved hypothetical protein [Ricinus communis]